MSLRTSLLSGVAIALLATGGMTVSGVAAQRTAQAQTQGITDVIAAYRQAQADLEAAQAGNGNVQQAQRNLRQVTAQLGRMCQALGQRDIETCIALVTGGDNAGQDQQQTQDQQPQDQQPQQEAQPQDQQAQPPQPTNQQQQTRQPQAEQSAPQLPRALRNLVEEYEKSAGAVVADPSNARARNTAERTLSQIARNCERLGFNTPDECLAQFGTSLTPLPEPVQAARPARPDNSQQQQQQPAPTGQQPASNDKAKAGAQQQTAIEQAPPPSGQPLPRALSRLVAAYEDANARLAKSVKGTREERAATNAIDDALARLSRQCRDLGISDVNACLANFGVALTPQATALAKAPAPEKPKVIPPQEQAPLLDSAKDAGTTTQEPMTTPPPRTKGGQQPPQSDAAAQANAVPDKLQSVETERGTRVRNGTPPVTPPPNTNVVQQDGLRIVLQFGNQLYLDNRDDSRLSMGAEDRYVEQLANGRTRETIIRRDGTRVVTIYNRNGDVLRRSRIDPEGRETVLVYVPDQYERNLQDWRDPGQDLPPLQLDIPPEDYVLDAEQADQDQLTQFLDEPPVESVQRLYSIDEVKRSARLRDMVRRLEIGNLTFEFGKATIAPDQIGALSNVAESMLQLIDRNPAETFLIEGHTDAVGSDIANLQLSDRRAETVAVVLTQVYGIPPENLATQGYGERYLKIRTELPERQNRRVTIRRITPLVAPENQNFSFN
ncbi:MAG TPA: OmpA family protein [Devosiaceae bacterium]